HDRAAQRKALCNHAGVTAVTSPQQGGTVCHGFPVGGIPNESADLVFTGRVLGKNPHVTEPVLDDVNKRIIEQLQRDGRMSYAALAKVVGLSEAAVRQRVQRLLDGEVMQIVA